MKVVNDLVVVEVPKGHNNWYVDNGILSQKERHPENSYTLPFPCTIIGLASEIDELHEIEILQAADYDIEVSLYELLHGNQLHTTDTTDLLFLKKA